MERDSQTAKNKKPQARQKKIIHRREENKLVGSTPCQPATDKPQTKTKNEKLKFEKNPSQEANLDEMRGERVGVPGDGRGAVPEEEGNDDLSRLEQLRVVAHLQRQGSGRDLPNIVIQLVAND